MTTAADAADGRPADTPTLVSVKKVWDSARHNAFTSLVRFHDRFYCGFREGLAHVAPDGSLRLLSSADGEDWQSVAKFSSTTGDVRDAQLVVTPDGKLMMHGCIAEPDPKVHKSVAWFSDDGSHWSDMVYIGEPNYWIWRVTFHGPTGYGIGYPTDGQSQGIRLYQSDDNGRTFKLLSKSLGDVGYTNEHAMLYDADGTALCLLRRDPGKAANGDPNAGKAAALVGTAKPPYTQWTWRDSAEHIGGPEMLRLPDGRILAGTRLDGGGPHMALSWLDPETASLRECLKLPSGGDCSYPGMVLLDDTLWVSYYSSHEGKTSIYLAKVKLPSRPKAR